MPLVWLLDVSGRALLWLLGQRGETEEKVTDEEIRMLVAEAEHHGTIESDERRMIAGVMRLGDRAVRAVMTPRTEVDWLNLEWDEATCRRMLMQTQHSRLPAGEGVVDAMVGVIQTRDILAAMLAGESFDPRRHVRPAPIVHDQADALDVLATLKKSQVPVALVHDEYGHFEGIVTPADILELIAGVFRSDAEEDEPPASAARTGHGCLPATCRPTRWPTTSASTCPRAATTRPSPATCCPSPPSAGDRRDGRCAGLALRGRRPRRPPHRQGPGRAPARRSPPDAAAVIRSRGAAAARPGDFCRPDCQAACASLPSFSRASLSTLAHQASSSSIAAAA